MTIMEVPLTELEGDIPEAREQVNNILDVIGLESETIILEQIELGNIKGQTYWENYILPCGCLLGWAGHCEGVQFYSIRNRVYEINASDNTGWDNSGTQAAENLVGMIELGDTPETSQYSALLRDLVAFHLNNRRASSEVAV